MAGRHVVVLKREQVKEEQAAKMELYIEERSLSIGDSPQELLIETPIKNAEIAIINLNAERFIIILRFVYNVLSAGLNNRFWLCLELPRCVVSPNRLMCRIFGIYVR